MRFLRHSLHSMPLPCLTLLCLTMQRLCFSPPGILRDASPLLFHALFPRVVSKQCHSPSLHSFALALRRVAMLRRCQSKPSQRCCTVPLQCTSKRSDVQRCVSLPLLFRAVHSRCHSVHCFTFAYPCFSIANQSIANLCHCQSKLFIS